MKIWNIRDYGACFSDELQTEKIPRAMLAGTTYAELLLHGEYSNSPEIAAANPALAHGMFTNQGHRCLVFWNDSDRELPLNLCGNTITRWATPFAEGEGSVERIAPNSTIVLFL